MRLRKGTGHASAATGIVKVGTLGMTMALDAGIHQANMQVAVINGVDECD